MSPIFLLKEFCLLNKHFYEHKTQYYETDQMRIIHHSNYIRWFEEARIDFMDQMGMSYDQMEKMGVIIPVLSVSADYKSMVRFGETVIIQTTISSYNGVKLALDYQVTDQETGDLRTMGSSLHCFLNEAGRPVSLKRTAPVIHQLFLDASK